MAAIPIVNICQDLVKICQTYVCFVARIFQILACRPMEKVAGPEGERHQTKLRLGKVGVAELDEAVFKTRVGWWF